MQVCLQNLHGKYEPGLVSTKLLLPVPNPNIGTFNF